MVLRMLFDALAEATSLLRGEAAIWLADLTTKYSMATMEEQ
jgi:hypothetical protein